MAGNVSIGFCVTPQWMCVRIFSLICSQEFPENNCNKENKGIRNQRPIYLIWQSIAPSGMKRLKFQFGLFFYFLRFSIFWESHSKKLATPGAITRVGSTFLNAG